MLFLAAPSVASFTLASLNSDVSDSCQAIAPVSARCNVQPACWLAMQDDNASGKVPAHLWDGLADPILPPLNVAEGGTSLGHPLRFAMSNSFAFGGANATLVLGRE